MKSMKHLMAAVAMSLSVAAHAQFTPSAIAENTAGPATNVTKTTNDSKPYRINLTDPLRTLNVVAWDGGSPTIYYFVPGGASGSIALPLGASYPDVALSTRSNTLNPYMVIVFRQGGNFVFRSYSWTGLTFTLMASVTWADAAGTFAPSINVDATVNGDYAVVIGRSDGSIETRTGTNITLPAPPAVSVATLPAGTGHQTDICVNTNSGVGTTNVHLSYTNGGNTAVVTRAAPFAGLAFGVPVLVAPVMASTTYADPRIASPGINGPACAATDVFSIIYDEINSTAPFYYIHLYSVEAIAGITNKVISGGAAGFPAPAIQFSKRPVLTYNEKFSYSFPAPNQCSGAIITSWTISSTTKSLVGEKLKSDGTLFGPVTYYDVTNPIRTGCDMSSISSKYTSDRVLLAFYDGINSRVMYKFFGYGAATMRMAGGDQQGMQLQKDLEVYPNPASDHIYLNYSNFAPDAVLNVHVTDITGRMSYNVQGELATLQGRVNDWFSLLTPGVYYLQCSDAEGFSKSLKIVKQ